MRWAMPTSMELVTRNVATQVKAPPIDRQRRVGLDVAEAMRLFDVIKDERLEALYVLALTTGLRRASSWPCAETTSTSDLGNCTSAAPYSGSTESSRLRSRRRAAHDGPLCCPGSRCATFRSTRNGRTPSARRSARHGGDHWLVFASSIGSQVAFYLARSSRLALTCADAILFQL